MTNPAQQLATPRRRRWQISLRTFLVGITVVALLLGLVVNSVLLPAQRQRNAVATIAALNGDVTYAPAPEDESWLVTKLRTYLPLDFFDPVEKVDFPWFEEHSERDSNGSWHTTRHNRNQHAAAQVDAALAHLAALPNLKQLNLQGMYFTAAGIACVRQNSKLEQIDFRESAITADGLAGISELRSLTTLDLGETGVGNDALVHVGKFSDLRFLGLSSTNISDSGLADLAGLKELKFLYLERTQINGSGFAHLRSLKNLRVLVVTGSQVSDEALINLQSLPGLRFLGLNGTQITDKGLAILASQESVDTLFLQNTRITDVGVRHLVSMKRLTSLYLPEGISLEAVEELRRAMPQCSIHHPRSEPPPPSL